MFPQTQSRVKRTKLSLPAMVDELGSLEQELLPIEGKLERVKALRAAIREAHADQPGEKDFAIDGKHYAAALGPCALESKLDLPKLFKRIGKLAFVKHATFALKHLANFDPAIAAECVTRERTGTRPLKVLPKGTP